MNEKIIGFIGLPLVFILITVFAIVFSKQEHTVEPILLTPEEAEREVNNIKIALYSPVNDYNLIKTTIGNLEPKYNFPEEIKDSTQLSVTINPEKLYDELTNNTPAGFNTADFYKYISSINNINIPNLQERTITLSIPTSIDKELSLVPNELSQDATYGGVVVTLTNDDLNGKNTEKISQNKLENWFQETHEKSDFSELKDFAQYLANKYNTLGNTRVIPLSNGLTTTSTTGDYGWWLDKKSTENALKDALTTESAIEVNPSDILVPFLTKQPAQVEAQWIQKGYKFINPDVVDYKTALDFDTNNYIEVSIDNQMVTLIKDGNVVFTSPCVTGSTGRNTPKGMFKIAYCQRNATLRGPGYATKVSYWMPFYNGCGFHDATWNNGHYGNKTWYIRHGSHGCVNMPLDKAKELFSLVQAGTAVIVY